MVFVKQTSGVSLFLPDADQVSVLQRRQSRAGSVPLELRRAHQGIEQPRCARTRSLILIGGIHELQQRSRDLLVLPRRSPLEQRGFQTVEEPGDKFRFLIEAPASVVQVWSDSATCGVAHGGLAGACRSRQRCEPTGCVKVFLPGEKVPSCVAVADAKQDAIALLAEAMPLAEAAIAGDLAARRG